MQLQALLCTHNHVSSGHTSDAAHVTCFSDHMTAVSAHVEASLVEGMVGELSLRLLTWPHTGKIQEVQCLMSIQ